MSRGERSAAVAVVVPLFRLVDPARAGELLPRLRGHVLLALGAERALPSVLTDAVLAVRDTLPEVLAAARAAA
ncbi:hypothetical protein [Embleya sp. NPDC005575]|uniref:hypothetical protein n=1 Tax=Embleya sp. NPDC005575 TaxID=3156892 RepID=UPI0033B6D5FA